MPTAEDEFVDAEADLGREAEERRGGGVAVHDFVLSGGDGSLMLKRSEFSLRSRRAVRASESSQSAVGCQPRFLQAMAVGVGILRFGLDGGVEGLK